MTSEEIIVFTDGSCVHNGTSKAKAGIGLIFPQAEFPDCAETFVLRPITNQRAELWAIFRALKVISQAQLPNQIKRISIYTDSLYSIKCLTLWIKKWQQNGWKSTTGHDVKNKDIIQPIYDLISRLQSIELVEPTKPAHEPNNKTRTIQFIHVRSHTGGTTFEALNNKRADELAGSITKI